MALADPEPKAPPPPDPLRIEGVSRDDLSDRMLNFTFNRPPTDDELRQMSNLPPSPQVARDAQHFAERLILAELSTRLFRVLVLGNIILPDSPAAMDWLRDWIDGNLEGHGPMGSGPMIWPDRIPSVVSLLRQWGFQPTPTVPPYVARRQQPPVDQVPS